MPGNWVFWHGSVGLYELAIFFCHAVEEWASKLFHVTSSVPRNFVDPMRPPSKIVKAYSYR